MSNTLQPKIKSESDSDATGNKSKKGIADNVRFELMRESGRFRLVYLLILLG